MTNPDLKHQALKDTIRQRAQALGFPLFGVADAAPPPRADFVMDWVNQGLHGGLHYMAETAHIRTDARRLMPGAKTVLCFAMPHFHRGPNQSQTGQDEAFVARYAWGRDYHNLVGKRLRKLDAWLRQQNIKTCLTVDTKPLLEKSYAAQAGLGFIGKNTMLIHPVYGSHLHLASILIDQELPLDQPLVVNCGTCQACQPACPTGALNQAWVIDARACFSNHTIEKRGQVPEEFQEQLPRLLFGCDICQDVCPFNREVSEAQEPDTLPRPGRPLSKLSDLDDMSEQTWLTWSEGSPLRRQSFQGLKKMVKLLKSRS